MLFLDVDYDIKDYIYIVVSQRECWKLGNYTEEDKNNDIKNFSTFEDSGIVIEDII